MNCDKLFHNSSLQKAAESSGVAGESGCATRAKAGAFAYGVRRANAHGATCRKHTVRCKRLRLTKSDRLDETRHPGQASKIAGRSALRQSTRRFRGLSS